MSSSRRPSSSRPTSASRRPSAASEHKSSSPDVKSKAIQDSGEFMYECKAGFLTVAEDIKGNLDSKKHLQEALQQTGRNPSNKALDKFWTSNKESVSFDEFVDICRKVKQTTEDDLMTAFKKIDRNSDGFISNNELFKVMCHKGEKMSQEEVQRIIDEVDEDGNGKMDYKEFCNMMLSTQEEAKKVAKRRMEKKEKRKAVKVESSPGSARKTKKTPEKSEDVKLGSQTSLGSANSEHKTNAADPMGSKVSIKSSSTLKASDQNMDDVKMGSQVSLKSNKSEKQNDAMGSQVYLKSEKKTEDMASRLSVKSAKSEKKSEDMGSRVSIKSTRGEMKSDEMGSRVSLKSAREKQANDDMGSNVSIKSKSAKKNEAMGSHISLKPSTSAEYSKHDPMGSQVSLKSNASARSRRHDKTGSTASIRSLLEKSKEEEVQVTAVDSGEVRNAADGGNDEETAEKNGANDSDESKGTESKDAEEDSDDDDIVVGSKVSLQKKSSKNDMTPPKPKPRNSMKPPTGAQVSEKPSTTNNKDRKERSKSPVISPDKKLKLSEPKKLKDWNYCHYKGCFFVEDNDQIVTHYFALVVPEDTSVWITIQSFGLRPGADLHSQREGLPPLDTILFLLRDKPDKDGNVLLTFTRHRDSKGKYGLRCDLPKGKYKLIPFTTGCRFHSRKSEPKIETKLVKKDKEGKFVLTKAFKEVLLDVFEVCDLDGNGTLSREEFSLFNVRTSGEEVADEEWDVVEENVELRNNELTHKGFLDLNQLEAEDNQGDTEDFWVTLQSMGYNKGLIMDEACPYKVEVYTEDCNADLKVVGLTSDNRYMETILSQAVVQQGDGTKVKNMKDLFVYIFSNNFWACLVLQNKSYSDVSVEVDCTSSENVATHKRNLKSVVKVPAKSALISHHLLPEDENKSWTIRWLEQIVK